MPTLKEIKGRIASVKSTLKITSAMKLVSSAKLRKAQKAIEAMRPYQETLESMLAAVEIPGQAGNDVMPGSPLVMPGTDRASQPRVIVAIASNSSLCGGFNANAVAKVRSVRKPGDTVYSIGRKMADAMARDGFRSPKDFSALSEHPQYAPAAALVESLAKEVAEGRASQVLLVYNHFVSTGKQVPVVETLLTGGDMIPSAKENADAPGIMPPPVKNDTGDSDYIIEPSASELKAQLVPKTIKLKLLAAILDSAAAEHAARTVAMQTATDNAQTLLDELTLQYNKGRQQKITAEILTLTTYE